VSTIERERGPVEILCKEIEFRFDLSMETLPIFTMFVDHLVDEIEDMRSMRERLSSIPGVLTGPPSPDSGEVLYRVREMLKHESRDSLVREASLVHDYILQVEGPEDGPCDHLIDMLSSCVSAIRFGLEKPCHSRHAASAADHIWKHRYGVTLFDGFTPSWQKDWARSKLQEAIVGLAILT
jgi:hypothetical protein